MTDDTETETRDDTDPNTDAVSERPESDSHEAVDRLAQQYTDEGRPFARVTVVRREPPVSAHVGDRAVVTLDGDLTGWIGGVACAQSVAVREAQNALRRGEPTLVGIAPDPEAIDRPGLEAFPMTCHSQGTLELFIEPVVPVSRLVVVGSSPIARALTRLATGLSFDVTVATTDEDGVDGADAVIHVDPNSSSLEEELRGATWVVAASMGATDDVAVEAALAAGVPYIGLVASTRRAAELTERVAERTGRSPEAVRAEVSSPAGLDIGARTPEEVGVSIVAELVSVRRSSEVDTGAQPADHGVENGAVAEADSGDSDAGHENDSDAGHENDSDAGHENDSDPDESVIDPVCGMTVVVGEAAETAVHDGDTYHFCGVGCKEAFIDDPERFLERVGP